MMRRNGIFPNSRLDQRSRPFFLMPAQGLPVAMLARAQAALSEGE
jgi:hypothetical protein